MAIELYPHNQETYEKMTKMFETNNRVGVVQPTGTGKSFLYLKWMEDHPQDRFAVLSPSTEIFTQMREYAESSGSPELLDSVQMISYQALLRMTDDEIRDIRANKIVLDEFHRTGAEQWGPALQKLLDANPQTQVLGASATPVRYLDDAKDMASELFDRNLAVEMTLGEAVRRDILPTPKYVPVWYDIDGKLAQYERDISKIKNKEERKELEEQLKQMKRQLENSYGAEDIFKKNMSHDHGKFIVFCRDREHLEEMKRTVPRWMAGVNSNVRKYVSISAESDKDLQLQAFKDDKGEDAVNLLFTIDRLNEGVHIKGIDGVIMLRPTVSPIIYLQQMGRALAAGGEAPLIFDMVNNYQNVQVPLSDGETRNVFEAEFRGGVGSEVEVGDFRIFEDIMEFTSVFKHLEDSLYPSNDEIWKEKLDLYVEFKKTFHREPSEREIYNGETLGSWCITQRQLQKNGLLLQDRMQKLLDCGFVFNTNNLRWNKMFDMYIQFKKEFNREPAQREVYFNENLGYWCSTQRGLERNGKLSPERKQLLLCNGFSFNLLEDNWNRMFNLSVEYKQLFGKEPSSSLIYKGERLGAWYHALKHDYQIGELSDFRCKKLENAGFFWVILMNFAGMRC